MTSSNLWLKRNKNIDNTTLNFNSQSEGARLLGLSSLGWIVTLFGIIVAGYLGRHFTEVIVFNVADGWCPPNVTAIGQHCFGDFGHPFARGGQPQVYLKDNLVAVNSPLTMLLFEIIRIFDYRIALFLFLLIGTASALSPVWWATKSWPMMTRFISYFLIGFGSLGFISAFDRANPTIFFPGLILWFILAIENEKRTQVILAIALMSALKFWGPLFAISLIMDRKWRDVIKCAVLTLALYALPLLYFPGRFLTKAQITLNGITSQHYASIFQPYVISISGLIRRISCGFSEGTTCHTVSVHWGIFGTSLFTITIALSISAWAAIQYRKNPKTSVMKYLPVIVLGAIALPTAQVYNSILFVPAASLILKWHSPFGLNTQKGIPKLLVPAVLSGVVPLPIWLFSDSILSSANDWAGPVFRISYWIIPIMWALLIFETLCRSDKFRRLPFIGRYSVEDLTTEKNIEISPT